MQVKKYAHFLSESGFMNRKSSFVISLSTVPMRMSLPIMTKLYLDRSKLSSAMLKISHPPSFSAINPATFFAEPYLLAYIMHTDIFYLLNRM